jgi:hypothetical protein
MRMEDIGQVVTIILKLGMIMALFIGSIVLIGYIFSKIMNKGFNITEKLEKKMSKGKNIDPFWPTIKDKETAIIVAKNASYFVFLITFISAILSVFQLFGATRLGLIDAALFGIIGFGLYKLSRFAAVAGLLIYFLGKVYTLLVYLLNFREWIEKAKIWSIFLIS